MKKNLLILAIIALSGLTLMSSIFAIRYKKHIQVLNNEIMQLNETISNIDINKDKNLKSSYAESFDIKLQECMKSCNYTTACMNNCTYEAIPKWEKEIDKNIMLLEKIMNKEQIELLHDSQKKWITYKDAQQKLNDNTIGTMMGTLYTNILAADQKYIIEHRAKELDELYYIYSNK